MSQPVISLFIDMMSNVITNLKTQQATMIQDVNIGTRLLKMCTDLEFEY